MTDRSGARADSHFREGGADYAKYRPTYPPELAAALAELAPRRDVAVDVGCGTGQLSLLLSEHFAQVEALDVSADQIANAEPRPNVRYAVAGADVLGLTEGAADLITVAQAAHWFDLPAFYAEARRIAAPGAVLALITYGVPILAGPLADRFERFYWREMSAFWPPERHHVETGYADLPFPFEPIAPPDLAIERLWPLGALLGYIETWSATRQARKQGEGARIEAFAADAEALCRSGDADPFPVRWPIKMRLGRL